MSSKHFQYIISKNRPTVKAFINLLTDIKSGNLNRDFVAIAYVYADIDNETGG